MFTSKVCQSPSDGTENVVWMEGCRTLLRWKMLPWHPQEEGICSGASQLL
jgi:hypothetical protein